MNDYHKPVLLQEIVRELKPFEGMRLLDATLGGGGHLIELIKQTNLNCSFVALDKDIEAIEYVKKKFIESGCEIEQKIGFTEIQNKKLKGYLIKTDFRELESALEITDITSFDLIIADLGVSSNQLDSKERGFSYEKDSLLDMRMDQNETLTAKDLVNGLYENELCRIFREYGEEKYARSIAKRIVKYREVREIRTTYELFNIIKEAVPSRDPKVIKKSAQRVFQALRILLNDELVALEAFTKIAFGQLSKKGRMGIISFHSLEDRIIKNFIKTKVGIETKLILPEQDEILINNRSRSAKLRIIIKHDK